MEQVLYQLVGIGATWVWAFVLTGIILLAIKHTLGLRVTEPEEEAGLDVSEHGEPAYTS
jgi:Amt family ammonium transporter